MSTLARCPSRSIFGIHVDFSRGLKDSFYFPSYCMAPVRTYFEKALGIPSSSSDSAAVSCQSNMRQNSSSADSASSLDSAYEQ
jgi:hypothetical protein